MITPKLMNAFVMNYLVWVEPSQRKWLDFGTDSGHVGILSVCDC